MPDIGNSNFIVHSLLRAHNWQHRPQLDGVCNWWRAGGRGVCALIGMGGAGKTAVAERFLRILPGGLPADDKDSSLPTPHSVFVFSFYDAPNADAFFESLQMWLQNTPQVETRLQIGQMLFMLQQRQGLIVLDGLERVQHDGQRGEFGRLHSPKLRDFLNQLAAGNFADLSVLVTSRFPLADLRDRNPRYFHPILVNQIDLAAGVQLLRDRKVRGTDQQLEPIVEHCGRHALTVDFAGGYIAEYGNGDPTTPLNLGTVEELREASEKDELDDDQREVLRQGYRFARIAEHYRDAMLQKDEAAMALLERICLFRLGVDSETLADIFTGEDAGEVSRKALAELAAEQLQSKLDWLVRMRIVEATPWHGHPGRDEPEPGQANTGRMPVPRYSIHPAVRDGFLSGIGRDAAVAGHEAVRKGLEVSLEVSLGGAPGENPSDPATLDLLEEIVHHTLQSGHVREAWDIHRNRIGGYQNLGWRLGVYERGERICRAFAGGQSAETVVARSQKREPTALAAGDSMDCGTDGPEASAFGSPSQGRGEQGLPPSSTSAHSSPAALPPATRSDGRRPDEAPFLDLPEATQSIFINEWALYLSDLGRLAAAARCYELVTEMAVRQENWSDASQVNQNLCDVWLLSGRLSRLPQAEGGRTATVGRRQDETDESLPPSSFVARPSEASPATSARLGASRAGALATADEALRLAELADDKYGRQQSNSCRGHTRALCGKIPSALVDFQVALEWQHKIETHAQSRPLYSNRGVWHTQHLTRLGRFRVAMQLAEGNQKACIEFAGHDHMYFGHCQLVLSSLSLAGSVSGASSSVSSAALWTQARDWALARDAKEVLCWSCLVEAQHGLARGTAILAVMEAEDGKSRAGSPCHEDFTAAGSALESGLKIARDCGYGLYHIDLLLERARLHLLQGDAQAALDDIEIALGDEAGGGGIPANEATGQPELLAARHPACGYAWPVPFGLQLRAEALLLQAAQQLGSDSFVPAKRAELPSEAGKCISLAEALLEEALELWQPLHDPEPERDDQNFKLNGKQYNYKAVETHRILADLEGGILTVYPLESVKPSELTEHEDSNGPLQENLMTGFDTFLSHNSEDKPEIRRLKNRLVSDYQLTAWLDEDDLRPGLPWQDALEEIITSCKSAAVCVGANGLGPWEEPEMKALLRRFVEEKKSGNLVPIIPVLLPGAPDNVTLPPFLQEFTWVDLRGGLKKDGMDRLVWGITGTKPKP